MTMGGSMLASVFLTSGFALAFTGGAPMLDIGNMTVCFPFFLLLAFLFAALYAQGKSPLGFFDITSPQKQTVRQPGVRSYQFMSGAASLQRNALTLLKGGVISGLAQKAGLKFSKYNSIQFAGYQVRQITRGRHKGELQVKRGSRWETLTDADGKALRLDAKLGSALSAEALQNAFDIRAYADGKMVGKDGALLPLPGLGTVKNAELQKALSEIFTNAKVMALTESGKIQPTGAFKLEGEAGNRVNLTNMVLTRSAIGGGRLGHYQRASAGETSALERIYNFPADAILAKRINLRTEKGILSRGYMRYRTFAFTEKARAAKNEAYQAQFDELIKQRSLRDGVQLDQARMQSSLFYGELQWAAKTSLITTTIPVFGGMLKQYKYAGVMAAATGRTVVNAHAIGRQMRDWRKNPAEYKKSIENSKQMLEQRREQQKDKIEVLKAEIAKLEGMLKSRSMLDFETGQRYKNAEEIKNAISVRKNNLGNEVKRLESLEVQLAAAYARADTPPPQITRGQSLRMLGRFYADYYLSDPVSRLMANRADNNRLKAERLRKEALENAEPVPQLNEKAERLNALKPAMAGALDAIREGNSGKLFLNMKRFEGQIKFLDHKLAAIDATIAAADIGERLAELAMNGKAESKEADALRRELAEAMAAKRSLDEKVLGAAAPEEREKLRALEAQHASASGDERIRLEHEIKEMNAKIGIFGLEDVHARAFRAVAKEQEKDILIRTKERLELDRRTLHGYLRPIDDAMEAQLKISGLNAELAGLEKSGKTPGSPGVREVRRKIAVSREALEMHARELERSMVTVDEQRRGALAEAGMLAAALKDAEKNAAKYTARYKYYDLGKEQRKLLHEREQRLQEESDIGEQIAALEAAPKPSNTPESDEVKKKIEALEQKQKAVQSSIDDINTRLAAFDDEIWGRGNAKTGEEVEPGFTRWLRASAGARQHAREMAQERFSSAHGRAPAKIGELDMFLAGMSARPLFGLLPPVVRMDVDKEGKFYIGREHEEWLIKNEARLRYLNRPADIVAASVNVENVLQPQLGDYAGLRRERQWAESNKTVIEQGIRIKANEIAFAEMQISHAEEGLEHAKKIAELENLRPKAAAVELLKSELAEAERGIAKADISNKAAASAKLVLAKSTLELAELRQKKEERLLGDWSEVAVAFVNSKDPAERAALLEKSKKLGSDNDITEMNKQEAALEKRVADAKSAYKEAAGKEAEASKGAVEANNYYQYADKKAKTIEALLSSANDLLAKQEAALKQVNDSKQAVKDAKAFDEQMDAKIALDNAMMRANGIEAHLGGVRGNVLIASLSEEPEAAIRGAKLHWASGRELARNERSKVVENAKMMYSPLSDASVSDASPLSGVEAQLQRRHNGLEGSKALKAMLEAERSQLERDRVTANQAFSEADEKIRKAEAVIIGQDAQFQLEIMADEQSRQSDLKSRIARLSLEQDRLQLGREDPEWQRLEGKKNGFRQQLVVSEEHMKGAALRLEGLPESAKDNAAKVVELERQQEDLAYTQGRIAAGKLGDEETQKRASGLLGSDYRVQRYADFTRIDDALEAKDVAEPERLALERMFGGEQALERCASTITLDKSFARMQSEDPAEREVGARKLDVWRGTSEGARFISEQFGPDARFAQLAAGQAGVTVGGAREFNSAISKKLAQAGIDKERENIKDAAASNAKAEELMKNLGVDTLGERNFGRALGENQLKELATQAKDVQELVSIRGSLNEREYRDFLAKKTEHMRSFESIAPPGRVAETEKLYEYLGGLDGKKASQFAGYLQNRVEFESRLASLPQLTELEQKTFEAVRARVHSDAEQIDRVSKSLGPGRQRVIAAFEQREALDSVENAIHGGDFRRLTLSVAGMLKDRARADGVAPEDAEASSRAAELISNWSQAQRSDLKGLGVSEDRMKELDSAVKQATGINGFSEFAERMRTTPLEAGQAHIPAVREAENRPIIEGLRKLRDEVFEARSAALKGIGEKKTELDFNSVLAAASSLHTELMVERVATIISLSHKLESGAQLNAGEAALLEAVTNGAVRAEAGAVTPEKARQAIPAVEREKSALRNAVHEAAEEQRHEIETQLGVRSALNSARLTGQLPGDLEARANRLEDGISRASKDIRDAKRDLAAANSNYGAFVTALGRQPGAPDSKKYEDEVASAKSRLFEAERELKKLEDNLYRTGSEFEYRVMLARKEQGFAGENTEARIKDILAEFPEFKEKHANIKAAREQLWALAGSTKAPHDETEEKRSFIYRAMLDSTAERELWFKAKDRKLREKAAMAAVRYGTLPAAGVALAMVSPAAGATLMIGGELLLLSLDRTRGFLANRDYDYLHVPAEKEMFFSAIMTDRASGIGYSILPEKSMLLHRNLYRAVVEGVKRSGYGGSLSMAPPVARILPGFGLLHRFEYGFLKLAAVKPGAELRYRYGQFISGGKERFMEEYREPTHYSLALNPDIVGTQEAKMIVVSPTQFQERIALSTGVRRLKRQYMDELRTEDLIRHGVGAMVDKGPLVYAESQEARHGAIMPPRRAKSDKNGFVVRMLKAGKS